MSQTVIADRQGRPGPSATWVWSLKADEVLGAVRFLNEHRVRTVFLSVVSPASQPLVIGMAEKLSASGVEVQCLGSDPGWLEQPGAAVQWLAQAQACAQFDAVHLDVEPWALPAWPGDHELLLEQYVRLLSTVREPGLPLEADVPPWLASKETATGCAFDRILSAVDRVTLLAYRDHAHGANGILEFSRAAREACSRHGVSYRIGVETQPAEAAGGSGNTFAEEGQLVLLRETALVSQQLSADPHYLGIAVHDWRHWRALC